MYFYSLKTFSERTARIALLFGCFWYEFIVFAHKPMTNLIATNIIMIMLALSVKNPSRLRLCLTGLLSVLAITIRVQTTPLIVFMLLIIIAKCSEEKRNYIILSCIFAAYCFGLLDKLTWGGWWHTYYTSFNYNALKGVAASFGTHPFYYYFLLLTYSSAGLFYPTFIYSILPKNFKKYLFLTTAITIIILIHSLFKHKEYRFIFTIIPFWLILVSV